MHTCGLKQNGNIRGCGRFVHVQVTTRHGEPMSVCQSLHAAAPVEGLGGAIAVTALRGLQGHFKDL